MLFTILIVFLFLLVFVPTFFLSVITKVLSFFGFGAKKEDPQGKGEFHNAHTRKKDTGTAKSKKIFDKNEGEYVDFEEIE